ncbi:MAG: glycosyltransferase family 4 protein [Patescibacteria group bacterium]|jgi:glycosyltransferase involved in cell wall biosynthesis
MKVLVFSTAYLPFIGGAEIAVKEITGRIKGIEFDLITARLDKKLPWKEKIGRVNIYRLGFGFKIDKFLLPLLGFFQAINLNRENNYSVIWSIMASQGSLAASFFKILHPEKKLLLNMQEGDEEEHLKRYAFGNEILFKIFVQPIHRLVIKKADCITAISASLKERAISSGAKCPIIIVPNGVDVEKFFAQGEFAPDGKVLCPRQFLIEDFKKKLGIENDEKVIVTVSRLVKKNGIEDLIRGVNLLAEENPEIKWKLLIIGSGELEDRLKRLSSELNLDKIIIFLGSVSHNEVPRYLWISDIFIRPSLSEGLGNVFLEAMAAGTPVIATPVGGIVDFLKDNETGLFCQPSDPVSIKNKLLNLFNDKELSGRLALNGEKIVREKYGWTLIAESYFRIFKEISDK